MEALTRAERYALYDVRRYQADAKTFNEQQAAGALLEGVHTYERVGHDRRAISFQADGTVGLGAAGRELFWDLRQEGERIVFELASETEVTCRLTPDEGGVWRGQWFHAERMLIAIYRSVITMPDAWEQNALEAPDAHAKASAGSAVKVGLHSHFTRAFSVPVLSEVRGDFASVRNTNVLIYFRHGFGDLVQLSCILPLLDSSNRYWIVRFGDDYTSILEGSAYITPLYLGIHSIKCDDGGAFCNRHFGMDLNNADGSRMTLNLPLSLYDRCVENEIGIVLHINFPEVLGLSAVPYHTKARFILHSLVGRRAFALEGLCAPLKTAIDFEVDAWVMNWVQTRLRNNTGFGQRRLCLISRNGYTSVGKNWGHQWREDMPEGKRREGEECRDFMRLQLRKDPRWVFLTMEDDLF